MGTAKGYGRVWDGELRGLVACGYARQHELAARRAPFLAAPRPRDWTGRSACRGISATRGLRYPLRVMIRGEKMPILIREQGRKIKVIRRAKAADTGRFRHRVVGTFVASDPVPASLLELLDKSERRTLDSWLGAYRNAAEIEQAHVALTNASAQLASIVDALAIAADTLAPTEADRVWEQIHAIARTLRRAGHARPQRTRSNSIPLPGQRDLVDELEMEG